EKPMVPKAGVLVIPDNLAHVVDARRNSARKASGQGGVEGGVSAAAVKEARGDVSPDDLAHIVNPECNGAAGQRTVEGGVRAAAVKEAVEEDAGVTVVADDLARGVDALCNGAVCGQGIVEGGVGIDWHRPGLRCGHLRCKGRPSTN